MLNIYLTSKRFFCQVYISASVCFGAIAPATHAAESLTDALTYGKITGQARYRYEWVDQEGRTEKASASTLRTQLGYLTEDYLDLSVFSQFEDVRVVGNERYNSTINGLIQYPLVLDPEGTEINQAYLSYKGLSGTVLKYGRQVIAYDNYRFIGEAGWRQNQQTYDAFTVVNTSLAGTTLSYAHVINVNRVFGDHSAIGNLRMDGDLLNIAYRGWSAGTLISYGYFLDYTPAQPFAGAASNKTLGVRFDGSVRVSAYDILYTAERAHQSDYAEGAATVDADYTLGLLGINAGGVQAKLGYELLTGNGVYALQTPLASLHPFNGWADKFLSTPVDGLEDIFFSVGASPGGMGLLIVYHRYRADSLGYDYGSEWNLLVSKKLNKYLTLLVKYATYDGDSSTMGQVRNPALVRDLDRLWIQAEWQL